MHIFIFNHSEYELLLSQTSFHLFTPSMQDLYYTYIMLAGLATDTILFQLSWQTAARLQSLLLRMHHIVINIADSLLAGNLSWCFLTLDCWASQCQRTNPTSAVSFPIPLHPIFEHLCHSVFIILFRIDVMFMNQQISTLACSSCCWTE